MITFPLTPGLSDQRIISLNGRYKNQKGGNGSMGFYMSVSDKTEDSKWRNAAITFELGAGKSNGGDDGICEVGVGAGIIRDKCALVGGVALMFTANAFNNKGSIGSYRGVSGAVVGGKRLYRGISAQAGIGPAIKTIVYQDFGRPLSQPGGIGILLKSNVEVGCFVTSAATVSMIGEATYTAMPFTSPQRSSFMGRLGVQLSYRSMSKSAI